MSQNKLQMDSTIILLILAHYKPTVSNILEQTLHIIWKVPTLVQRAIWNQQMKMKSSKSQANLAVIKAQDMITLNLTSWSKLQVNYHILCN